MTETPITVPRNGIGKQFVVFDGISATATSDAIKNLLGAKAIGVQFTEYATVLNRSGALTASVSMDGTTFVSYAMFIDNNSTFARVSSKTLNAAGSSIIWLDPQTLGSIKDIKFTLTVTDGATPTGTFSVVMNVIY